MRKRINTRGNGNVISHVFELVKGRDRDAFALTRQGAWQHETKIQRGIRESLNASVNLGWKQPVRCYTHRVPAVESARTSGSNVGGASCIPRFRKQPRAKEFRSPACQFDATCHYEFRSCRWIITRILRASVSLNVTHYGKIKFRLSLSLCNYNVFCSPRKLLFSVPFCPGIVPRLLYFLRSQRTSIADNLRSSFSLERSLFLFLVCFCSFRLKRNYLIPVDNVSPIGTRCQKLSRGVELLGKILHICSIERNKISIPRFLRNGTARITLFGDL